MTAKSFKIEPALRRAARAAIFRSPPLNEDFRRAKRARRPSIWRIFYASVAVLFGVVMMGVFIPMLVIVEIEQQAGADGLLAFIAALSTEVSLCGAQLLVSRLRQSKPISVMSHLPASDARIAYYVYREIAAWSLVVLWPAALALGYLAWKNGFGFGGWALCTLLAATHWLTCLATGTSLAIFLPRFPFAAVSSLMAVAGVVYIQVGAPQLANVTFGLYVLVPAGWVNAVLGLAFLQQVAEAWLATAATIVWIVLAVLALKRLAQSYLIAELSFPPDAAASATLAPPFDQRANIIARIWQYVCPWWRNSTTVDEWELSETEAEQRIRAGTFLQSAVRPRSQWIERLVDFWLTDRERVVLELLTADRSRWSQWWWSIAFVGATVNILDAAGGVQVPANIAIGYVVVAYASLFYLWTGPWPGMRTNECAGAFVSWYSVLPAGFDEISNVMFKVGLVRCLSLFLLVFLLWACSTRPQIVNPQLALQIAIGYATVLLALQGWIINFYLAVGMRFPDLRLRTVGWHLLPLLLLFASLFVGLPLLIVGIAQQVPGAELLFAGGILVLGFCSWANWRVLRAMYHRGLIDLVRNNRSSSEELLIRYHAVERMQRESQERIRKYGWFWWLRPRDENERGG